MSLVLEEDERFNRIVRNAEFLIAYAEELSTEWSPEETAALIDITTKGFERILKTLLKACREPKIQNRRRGRAKNTDYVSDGRRKRRINEESKA